VRTDLRQSRPIDAEETNNRIDETTISDDGGILVEIIFPSFFAKRSLKITNGCNRTICSRVNGHEEAVGMLGIPRMIFPTSDIEGVGPLPSDHVKPRFVFLDDLESFENIDRIESIRR